MTRATEIDIAEAARLYGEGWRLRPLAEHLGCSFQRLSVHLRRAGVEMRGPSSPRAPRLPIGARREAIVAAYRARMPITRICARYCTTAQSVRTLAEMAGLSVKPPRGRLDRELLRRLHVGEKLTRAEIAERTGYRYGTISTALREIGLAHHRRRPKPTS
ncbi:hypothetical protein [Streptosporangium sp. NPDC051022]|uniref:hypothetical protein n=1 Tax=Streptosporangium sp. NPDC051022 TaxID=3155752 RepID=UPI00342AF2B8